VSTVKEYKRHTVEGRDDVELYKPGPLGLKPDSASKAPADEKKTAKPLPFAVEDEQSAKKKPQVIDGSHIQPKDRRGSGGPGARMAAPETRTRSSLMDDLKAEIDSPTPPPDEVLPEPGTTRAGKPVAAEAAPEPPEAKPEPKRKSAKPASAEPEAQAADKNDPKPQKKRKRMSTDPREQGRMVADSVVGGFVGALRGQAAKRGGALTVEDVEALSSSFERQAEVLAETFSRQLKGFAEARDKSHWVHERTHALNRVVVKKFSHLLVDEPELGKKPDGLSRRILPGFFSALEMMIGTEHLEEFESQAQATTEKLRRRFGAEFSWDHAYAHRDTKALILDVLIAAAPHFEELDRRLEWMRELINSHLPPAKPHSAKPDWALNDIGLIRLLDALFSDLRVALEDDLGRLRITKRHGFEVLEALLEAFETFDKKIEAAKK